jgi:hypothetical protein
MDSILYSNLRDKMILLILGILGLGCLIGIYLGVKDLLTPFGSIVGAFAMGFSGKATPPTESKTTETTVSETKPPAAAKQTTPPIDK